MSEKRELPHSTEAEKTVLGNMLLRAESVSDVLPVLRPDDFYHPAHQRIFEAIRSLTDSGVTADIVSVSERMEKDGTGKADAFTYLTALATDTFPAAHLEQHTDLIREKSALRQLAQISAQVYCDSCDGKIASGELIGRVSDDLYRISMGSTRGQVTRISEALLESYLEMSAACKSEGVLGVRTGFPRMDQMLSGLQSDQLIVVAGRPGMGKTSFAMNIVEHASLAEKKTCLVFSMEMSASQLATRLLCANAGVDMQKARTGSMGEADFERMGQAMRRLSAAPIYFDDSATVAVPEMTAKARRLQSTEGLGLVVVDYLQLMSIPGGRAENRNQEISKLTRSLKIMAKQLGVPVMLLSQLSRATERDPGKFPKLSDLRDSGAIEQDADVVIFLQRDDYYAETRTEENTGKATILIAKQRNGPTGPIDVRWDGSLTKYVEVDPYHGDEDAPGETPWDEPEGVLW